MFARVGRNKRKTAVKRIISILRDSNAYAGKGRNRFYTSREHNMKFASARDGVAYVNGLYWYQRYMKYWER